MRKCLKFKSLDNKINWFHFQHKIKTTTTKSDPKFKFTKHKVKRHIQTISIVFETTFGTLEKLDERKKVIWNQYYQFKNFFHKQ